MSQGDSKTTALARAAPEPTDQELVNAIRRSCLMFDRDASLIVTTCRKERKSDGTEKMILDFVDKKQGHEPDGSYLIVDGKTDDIFSVLRYSEKPPIFPVPPGKQLVVGRNYLMFRMGRT